MISRLLCVGVFWATATLVACSSPSTPDASAPIDGRVVDGDTTDVVDLDAPLVGDGRVEEDASTEDAVVVTDVADDAAPDAAPDAALCGAGFHRCGDVCASDSDVASCGARCSPCSATNGTATCAAGVCGITCVAGYGDCDGDVANGCEQSLADAIHCGACGAACAEPTPLCSTTSSGASSCQSGCGATQVRCAMSCVDAMSSPLHCGACGNACPAPSGGTATCTAGVCGTACPAGATLCGSACVNTASDAMHCGACSTICSAGASCFSGTCRPSNDDRAAALLTETLTSEVTVLGTTTRATFDGPAGCGASPPNVWYRFVLTSAQIFYADTAGSASDTVLYLTNSAGALLSDSCNDNSGCGVAGDFTSARQSRVARVLGAGTYYLAVGAATAATAGAFTLHLQRLRANYAAYLYTTPLSGRGSGSAGLVGSAGSMNPGCSVLCPSTDDVRWFMSCGVQQTTLSLCQSDGGSFVRRLGGTNYDPSMSVIFGATGTAVCSDNGPSSVNCRGTGVGADTMNLAPRYQDIPRRGITVMVLDERYNPNGLQYTLYYDIR